MAPHMPIGPSMPPPVTASSPISYPVMTPTGANGSLVPTGPNAGAHFDAPIVSNNFSPPVPPSTGHYIPPHHNQMLSPTAPVMTPTGPNAALSPTPVYTPTGPNGSLVPTGPNAASPTSVYTPTGPNGSLVPTGPNAGPSPMGAGGALFGDMVAMATGHAISPSVGAANSNGAGVAGFCVACSKPADYICSQTKVLIFPSFIYPYSSSSHMRMFMILMSLL
jgi:hypothetical protein